ncbi:hypothetical protein [Herbidospora sp. NBRC 101105]|uniref:hypothetical protein n=1 Tax=Herbidospora sp. NBRC 101105 TaxID=3032195 RepID=UPI0024A4B861|nr:hypothetical protein [Herbidospora sp. NBRC 101105]GLX95153.1 hypothetical protein Hesp01_31030 [Herbidospora sp. NBRC 101105]
MKHVLAALTLLATSQCAADPEAVYLVANHDQTVTVHNTIGLAVSDDLRLPEVAYVERISAADDGFHVLGLTGDFEPRYFRLRRPAYTPEPVDALKGVGTTKHAWAMTRDGTKVAFETVTRPSLVVRDVGTGRQTVTKVPDLSRLAWSPDGRRLLLTISLPCTPLPPSESGPASCLPEQQLRFLDADRPLRTFKEITADPVVTGDGILVGVPGEILHLAHDGTILDRFKGTGRLSLRKNQLMIQGGGRLTIGPLTGGNRRDLPWEDSVMATATW